MGAFSIWHWLIVLVVVLVLFGGSGKISKLMGDFGKGLKSFKKNIKEEVESADDTEPDRAIASDESKSTLNDTRKSKDRATSN